MFEVIIKTHFESNSSCEKNYLWFIKPIHTYKIVRAPKTPCQVGINLGLRPLIHIFVMNFHVKPVFNLC